jgi:hypothetical protein
LLVHLSSSHGREKGLYEPAATDPFEPLSVGVILLIQMYGTKNEIENTNAQVD